MFGFGYGEVFIVALIGLIFFGNRLPGAMKSVGLGINVFRKTIREESQKLTHTVDAGLNSPVTTDI